jgi:membrane-associated phospholipid phosphatase
MLVERWKREWREQHMLLTSFFVFLGVCVILLAAEFSYFAWQDWYIRNGGLVHSPQSPYDLMVPFVPEFAWPYWGYFLLLAFSVWLPKDHAGLARQAGGMVAVHFMGYASYLVYPSRMLRAPLHCEGLSCDAVGTLYQIDPGYGVFPSLHVALSVYMVMAVWSFRHPSRYFVTLLAVAICMATVLIKQHYLVDLPAGAVLGFGGWWLSWKAIDKAWEAYESGRFRLPFRETAG